MLSINTSSLARAMRVLFFLICLTLILVPEVWGGEQAEFERVEKMAFDASADMMIELYSQVKTPKDMVRVFGPFVKKQDRALLEAFANQVKELPKLRREGRKLVYSSSTETYAFEYPAFFSSRVLVNGIAMPMSSDSSLIERMLTYQKLEASRLAPGSKTTLLYLLVGPGLAQAAGPTSLITKAAVGSWNKLASACQHIREKASDWCFAGAFLVGSVLNDVYANVIKPGYNKVVCMGKSALGSACEGKVVENTCRDQKDKSQLTYRMRNPSNDAETFIYTMTFKDSGEPMQLMVMAVKTKDTKPLLNPDGTPHAVTVLYNHDGKVSSIEPKAASAEQSSYEVVAKILTAAYKVCDKGLYDEALKPSFKAVASSVLRPATPLTPITPAAPAGKSGAGSAAR